MSQVSKVDATPSSVPIAAKRTKSTIIGRFLRDKTAVVALIILLIIALFSFGAGFISDNILHQERDRLDREAILSQTRPPPFPPGTAGHVLGTDELGRDMLARLLYGGQVSLTVGILTAAISILLGSTLGLIGGFFGGWIDDIINAIMQFIINIPVIFLLIIFSFIVRFDPLTISLFIGLLSWVGSTRIVRGQVLGIRNREYIEAARVMGANNRRIIFRHVLPNVFTSVLVVVGFDVVGAMLTEAGLSYLGFGVAIPIPSWGNLLANRVSASTQQFQDPRLGDASLYLLVPPAVCLIVTLLCVYLVANGIRDAVDQKLKEK